MITMMTMITAMVLQKKVLVIVMAICPRSQIRTVPHDGVDGADSVLILLLLLVLLARCPPAGRPPLSSPGVSSQAPGALGLYRIAGWRK